MNRNELTAIGQIKKSHGLEGKVKVTIEQFYMQDFSQLTAVILQKGEDFLPFFVEVAELNAKPPIIKFESINTKEDATNLNGKTIYAIINQLSAVKEDEFDSLIGTKLFNANKELIGAITDIVEMPQQTMLQVEYNNQEILIPFHEDFILEHNENKKELHLQLPDGLLEIYD